MQCQHAQENFSDYIAGDMERALAASLENHVAACASCEAELAGLRRAWALLDKMPVVEPPADFHTRIMQRLDGERAAEDFAAVQPQRKLTWRTLFRAREMALVATLLIFVLAGVEVVQTQRAALGPLGWIVSRMRPAPVAPTLSAPPIWATARAEFRAAPEGGGVVTLHLRANPSGEGVSSIAYSARLGDGSVSHRGVVLSDKEAVVTLPVAPNQTNGPLAVVVSAGGSDTTLTVPTAP